MSEERKEYFDCVDGVNEGLENSGEFINPEHISRGQDARSARQEACGEIPPIETKNPLDIFDDAVSSIKEFFTDSADNDMASLTTEDKQQLIDKVLPDAIIGRKPMDMQEYKQLKDLQEVNDPVWGVSRDYNDNLMSTVETAPEAFISNYEPESAEPQISALKM